MINILPPSTNITLTGPTKWTTFLDGACLFLMTLPFVAIMIGLFLGGELFFWFPTGLETLLPAGIIALVIQLPKLITKRQLSILSMLVVIISPVVISMGIFGWMLIIAVAG